MNPPPRDAVQRMAVKLKPAAERMVKKGHPWVFEASIVKQNIEGKAGDLAIIFDQKKNKFLACGLYDPDSTIRIKLLQFHRPAKIDADWFAEKIRTAFQIRQPLLTSDTNSYRLLHGENDGLPGLVADVYDQVLVLKLYTPIWFPYLDEILPLLVRVSRCRCIVLRLSRSLQQKTSGWSDGQVIYGSLDKENVHFREYGLLFSANVVRGHKTGYFLDHRHNRRKIGTMAKGKKVLDVFAYAGGFSVHALVSGAQSVTSIDISAQALDAARRNAAQNPHSGVHRTQVGDAFELLAELAQRRETFDIVIIDPPSFAKQASETEKAKAHYQQLANLGAALVRKGGVLLLASCSSRVDADTFYECSKQGLLSSRRPFKMLEKTFHDIDHPIGFPEGAYLKAAYYQIN